MKGCVPRSAAYLSGKPIEAFTAMYPWALTHGVTADQIVPMMRVAGELDLRVVQQPTDRSWYTDNAWLAVYDTKDLFGNADEHIPSSHAVASSAGDTDIFDTLSGDVNHVDLIDTLLPKYSLVLLIKVTI